MGGAGAHREVGRVVVLPLPLGDRVEDDGGEVGHQVRRLAAQRREVPHLGWRPAFLELEFRSGGGRMELGSPP